MEINKMYKIALQYKQNAYTPYSHYKVGCCVKDIEGNYYGGCNIENASFSPTTVSYTHLTLPTSDLV